MRISTVLKLFLSVALVCSMVAIAQPPAADAGGYSPPWHWVNPEPTGDTILGVCMSPTTDSSCLWAVGAYGLIQKTFDYGQSWHKFDAAGITGHPTFFDIDLAADSVGWAVGENGTIVKISDGWNVAAQAAPTEAVGKTLYAVDALSDQIAYAVGQDGIVIKTTNGGTLWTTVSANVAGLTDFKAVVALSSTQCLVAGVGNGGTSNNDVFVFTGNPPGNFQNKSTGDVNFAAEDLAYDPVSNTAWVVGHDRAAWNVPLHYRVSDANVVANNSTAVFWAQTPPLPVDIVGALTGIAWADAQHVWVTTCQGELLFYNGTNWAEQKNHPYPSIWLNDVSFRKTSTNAYEGAIVGDNGAMAATTDGGTTAWVSRKSQTNDWLPSVDFISKSTGYVISGSDVLKTSDSGQTWSKLGDTGTSGLLDVDFKDANNGCAVGRQGGVAYVYNGTDWTLKSTGMGAGDLYSVCFLAADNIWASGDGGKIGHWNGTTWTMSTDPDVTTGSPLWYSIEVDAAGNGVAVGGSGKVVYTTDSGATWTSGTSGVTETIYSVDMVSASVGYMVGGDGGVANMLMRKTTDGGATWTQMTPPAGWSWRPLAAVSFADANNGWIVGMNGLILHTTNAGAFWTDEGMSWASLRAVAAAAPDAAFAVGDVGNMIANYYPPAKVKVYRFYNMKNGTHFYTSSYQEKLDVLAKWPDIFKYEGVGYEFDGELAKNPLYRFYNKVSQSHFYTVSADEANNVIAKWPDIYTFEGVAYNVSNTPVPAGGTVWRFYNLKTGSHFFTAGAAERDYVQATWPDVYKYEGPAFFLPY